MAVVQRIAHPNLLSLLWIGEREGHVCLGYEAFSGESLYNVIDHFLLEPPVIANITGALGQALEAIHVQGVWHRDLNPGWILLNRSGMPKIAGTGVSLGLVTTDRDHNMAMMRRPEYSRAYLAPEQVSPDGSSSDPLTDIFALGAIAYEMLVGNPPSGFAMAPSSRARVGTFVDQVIFRALHSNRTLRYASAAEFASDIQSIYAGHNNQHLLKRGAKEEGSASKARRLTRRGWIGVVAGGLLVLTGVVTGAWYFMRPQPPSTSASGSDHGAADALADRNLRNLAGTLSKKSVFMTKGQKENLMAAAAALLRNVMDAAPGSRKAESGMVAAELLMQSGEEDLSLETLLKLHAESPPDSVDWRRIEALTQLMRGSRAGMQAAGAAAERARRAGDLKGERNELARAAGFLPGSMELAAKGRNNLYNPVPALQATLSRMRGSRTGGPVQYSIRSRGLELHVDLSGNPRLVNVSPLAAFPITHLDLGGTAVSDLAPLARLPLRALRLDRTRVRDLTPVATGSIRLLTAEGCAITDPGSLEQCLVLQDYRISLRSGTVLTKVSEAHWGRPWVNSLGQSLQPIASRSRLLTATIEISERDYRIFMNRGDTAGVDAAQRLRNRARSRLATWRQSLDAPATGIRWADAQNFCAWLTDKERAAGQISVRARYRLLTPWEWNQAAGRYSENESRHSPLAGLGPVWHLAGNRPPAWDYETAGLPPGPTVRPAYGVNTKLRQLTGIGGVANDCPEWSEETWPIISTAASAVSTYSPGVAVNGGISGTGGAGGTDGLAAGKLGQHSVIDATFPAWTWRADSGLRSITGSDTVSAEDDHPLENLGFRIVLELPPVHALEGTE
ncbi:MAG: protein kinase family proteinGAF protein [Verrucomicrobiales bacterium]|nr:protein kinase family proteinGAF protein [Verrucomicrobiales bacterium]